MNVVRGDMTLIGPRPEVPEYLARLGAAGSDYVAVRPGLADAATVEFYDEADGRTRLEIRQWLPEHLAHPSEEGWRQAFTKLDATLMNVQAVAADHREVEAWQS